MRLFTPIRLFVMCLALGAIQCSCWSASVTINASKDNTIYANSPSNSGGGGPGIFSGGNTNSSPRRGLLAFDVAASIPAGATITAAQLTMYLGEAPTSVSYTVSLRRLTANWGEGNAGSSSLTISGTGNGFAALPGDATWNERLSGIASWTSPGALSDAAASSSASTVVSGPVDTPFTWLSTPSLVSDVQGWLDSPSTNFGWILINNGEEMSQTVKAFYSRSAAQNSTGGAVDPTWHPALSVTYSVPSLATGDYNGNGIVDAADYAVWRNAFGEAATPAGSGADGDQSGAIDDGDYSYWRARFGNVISGVGASKSVPEPASVALLMAAGALAFSRLRS